jgi:large subunit ribosomal protein L4
MPKKMRRAALRSALSAKAAEAGIVVVDEIALPEPKTRLMVDILGKLAGEASVLILMSEKDQSYDVAMRSADNLADTKVLLSSYLNIRDLLGYDKLLVPLKTLDALKAHLG